MIPPWSPSALDTFKSCPRQYEHKYVLKDVHDPPGEAQLYGTAVHKAFEDYQRDPAGSRLPTHLESHQSFMDEIAAGKLIGLEVKAALDKRIEPCSFFGPGVWWRGVIDHYSQVSPIRVRIVDYKTGKQHTKIQQLWQYALFAFAQGWREVEVMYYWTQTRQCLPRQIVPIEQRKRILDHFVPDLRQYAEAHKTSIWQPRPNGLCKRHCPVFGCEFNERSGPDG